MKTSSTTVYNDNSAVEKERVTSMRYSSIASSCLSVRNTRFELRVNPQYLRQRTRRMSQQRTITTLS